MGRATEHIYKDGNLILADKDLSPDNSMWDDCPLLAIRSDPSVGYIWENDFYHYITAEDGLTSTLTDTGSAAIDAGAGGILKILPSDGSVANNDEAYVGGTSAVVALAAGKDLWFETRVKFTEGSTDDANIIAGLSTVYAANTLQDDGAGPPANYDGIVFFKVDGGTVWQAETSSGDGTQTTIADVGTRTSGSYTRLGFGVSGISSVTFYIDGVAVGTTTATLPDTNMRPVWGLKNGADTTVEGLYVDWFRIAQLR
jgi:hypothetical protein